MSLNFGQDFFKPNLDIGLKTIDGRTIEAPSTKRDFCDTLGDGTDGLYVGSADPNIWAATSFTIGKRADNRNAILRYGIVWLKRLGNPGNITCSIRNADGSHLPTGNDLDSETKTQAQTATLTTQFSPISFTFNKEVLLNQSNQYTIVLTASGDVNNRYTVLSNDNVGRKDESYSSSADGSAWVEQQGDLMLNCIIYGVITD